MDPELQSGVLLHILSETPWDELELLCEKYDSSMASVRKDWPARKNTGEYWNSRCSKNKYYNNQNSANYNSGKQKQPY